MCVDLSTGTFYILLEKGSFVLGFVIAYSLTSDCLFIYEAMCVGLHDLSCEIRRMRRGMSVGELVSI